MRVDFEDRPPAINEKLNTARASFLDRTVDVDDQPEKLQKALESMWDIATFLGPSSKLSMPSERLADLGILSEGTSQEIKDRAARLKDDRNTVEMRMITVKREEEPIVLEGREIIISYIIDEEFISSVNPSKSLIAGLTVLERCLLVREVDNSLSVKMQKRAKITHFHDSEGNKILVETPSQDVYGSIRDQSLNPIVQEDSYLSDHDGFETTQPSGREIALIQAVTIEGIQLGYLSNEVQQ